jgi:hypothetical protein
MERMGHSSTRAALIYLHSTTGRQRALADTLGVHRGRTPPPIRQHLARMWHAEARPMPR